MRPVATRRCNLSLLENYEGSQPLSALDGEKLDWRGGVDFFFLSRISGIVALGTCAAQQTEFSSVVYYR